MLSLDDIQFTGKTLSRPECVLAHQSGLLFAPHWSNTGGVSVISPSGQTHTINATGWPIELRPNGIALEAGGSFLLAHLGDESGGIYRLFPDGSVEAVLTEIDGQPLPPANFVVKDETGALWVTVSTRLTPRALDYRQSANTGFIAHVLENGSSNTVSIVADGLGYANECLIDSARQRVLVNETFTRKLTQFDLSDDGSLHNRQTLCTFPAGTFPDGMALDDEGGIWIVSIVSNRVIRVANGRSEILLEDVDKAHLEFVEQAWLNDSMGRPHLDGVKSQRLCNISNIAFGGAHRKTAYLGCLLGDSIAYFESDFTGLAPVHWDASLGDLERYLE